MATHVFADMMHHLYQAFDLFEKGDKRRAVLRNDNFSYHQSFLAKLVILLVRKKLSLVKVKVKVIFLMAAMMT